VPRREERGSRTGGGGAAAAADVDDPFPGDAWLFLGLFNVSLRNRDVFCASDMGQGGQMVQGKQASLPLLLLPRVCFAHPP
jgi:hypothetical protein